MTRGAWSTRSRSWRTSSTRRCPGVPDSATVFRADLETRRVDTLARIRVGGSMGMFTRDDGITRVYAEPVAMPDNYAQLSDGSIAIVRGHDYHVDWILPDGSMKSTPRLPFDWKRLTDADKQRLIDSTAEATVAAMAAAFRARCGDSIGIRPGESPCRARGSRARRGLGRRRTGPECGTTKTRIPSARAEGSPRLLPGDPSRMPRHPTWTETCGSSRRRRRSRSRESSCTTS